VHNDTELAVASTILGVRLGACHVQGTLLGYGERCGNARLSSIIPNLQLKMGYDCIGGNIKKLYAVCREAAEITNLAFDETLPYVGRNAFAHKGGMHIDGLCKAEGSFEHTDPSAVGNSREFLLSEVAGRSALTEKLKTEFPDLAADKARVSKMMETLKELESEGYSFEGAESSFKLFVLKQLGLHKQRFSLVHFKVSDEPTHENSFGAYAVVKVHVHAQLFVNHLQRSFCGFFKLMLHRASVGITEHDGLRACAARGFEHFERVARIGLVTIIIMLRIKNNFPAAVF